MHPVQKLATSTDDQPLQVFIFYSQASKSSFVAIPRMISNGDAETLPQYSHTRAQMITINVGPIWTSTSAAKIASAVTKETCEVGSTVYSSKSQGVKEEAKLTISDTVENPLNTIL